MYGYLANHHTQVGCVHLTHGDAVTFYNQLHPGDEVLVVA
jgi:lipoprotein-anchoring transpeptidase ErfK/SrfK